MFDSYYESKYFPDRKYLFKFEIMLPAVRISASVLESTCTIFWMLHPEKIFFIMKINNFRGYLPK